jgi:hypothetical protein
MRELLSTYRSRWNVARIVRLAVQSRAFNQECDAAIATGVMPSGVWR